MNRITCKRFIQDNRERLPVKPPTEAQIDLMYSLAEMKGVTPSETCEVEYAAWDEFMSTNITRDDVDRGYEALVRLQKGRAAAAIRGIWYWNGWKVAPCGCIPDPPC